MYGFVLFSTVQLYIICIISSNMQANTTQSANSHHSAILNLTYYGQITFVELKYYLFSVLVFFSQNVLKIKGRRGKPSRRRRPTWSAPSAWRWPRRRSSSVRGSTWSVPAAGPGWRAVRSAGGPTPPPPSDTATRRTTWPLSRN